MQFQVTDLFAYTIAHLVDNRQYCFISRDQISLKERLAFILYMTTFFSNT